MKIIGIDLGTTNSCVAVMEGNEPTVIPNSEGKQTTPSVVAFVDGEKGGRKVGDPAKRQAITNPQHTISSVKRFMGKKFSDVSTDDVAYKVESGANDTVRIRIGKRNYTPQEISSIILQKMKSSAKDYLDEDIKEAVITVPAYFNDMERQATKEAGQIAGFEVKRVLSEPTAAALAYGLDKRNKDLLIAVYDLGGGTMDVSVLEVGDGVFEVKATKGDVALGGDDFDAAIITHLAETFKKEEGVDLRKDPISLQRLKEAAEKAKIELSSVQATEINLPYVTSVDGVPKHLVTTLQRAKFEALIDEFIQRTITPCKQALKDAKISVSDIDEVILVGGSTRVPKVQEEVEKFFRRKPSKGVNPDEVVAIGAAIQGGVLTGDVKDVLLLDVTPLGLGIETMGGVLTKLIEANTTIPTKKSQVFSTAADNQPSVEVHVLQGDRPMAKDNRTIGRFHLEGIPSAPRGVPQIEVTLDLDANGILNVSAKDKGTNKEQKIRIEASSGLTEEEIEKMKREAKENASVDQEERAAVDKRNAADAQVFQTEKQLKEYADKLSPEGKKRVEDALQALKDAQKSDDLSAIEAANGALTEAWTSVSQEIYAAAGAPNAPNAPNAEQAADPKASATEKGGDTVSDVEYEDVDEKKK